MAAFIEQMSGTHAAPTVKLTLAALKRLFDFLVTGQVIEANPAASVRGPRYAVTRGKTPVLSVDEARQLLDAIERDTIAGLRDRALICLMLFSLARIGAAVAMNVEDYFQQGRRMWFRLHEKRGKVHDVRAHHSAEEAMDAYLTATGIAAEPKSPLFRTLGRDGQVTKRRLLAREALAMVKRRARRAGLPATICCHSFRATGITAFLLAGGTLESAQRIANHSSPRTTKLYDGSADQITLDEVERIRI